MNILKVWHWKPDTPIKLLQGHVEAAISLSNMISVMCPFE